MSLLPYHLLFPEIGTAETRILRGPREARNPTGEFGFFEVYCVDPRCDCKRVLLNVYPRAGDQPVATISHEFDEKNADPDLGQTYLDPINRQSRKARMFLDFFTQVLLHDKDYVKNLKRRYREVKIAIADPGHPIHARIAKMIEPPRQARKPPASSPRPAGKPAARARTPEKKRGPGGRAATPVRETPPPPPIEIPRIDAVDVRLGAADWTSWAVALASPGDPAEVFLRIDYERLKLRGEFEDLLAPAHLPNIEKYWFQIETVRKTLRRFHGRVLLADEVGLGKTIEAGLLIKEYLLRGLARRVLILAPSSLVSQWQEEMRSKFDLDFETTEGATFTGDANRFWSGNLILASLHTAKTRKNADRVAAEAFDIVVVDEAHHLRNRGTLAWQLVNRLQKRFLFLLSATPVQNNLVELFNLITLLKPGLFQTEAVFRREFMAKGAGAPGSDRKPANTRVWNKEKLRELLRDVMIRNTRSAIDLKLPKRFATTIRLAPSAAEAAVLGELEAFLRDGLTAGGIRRPTVELLLREAGSSPHALAGTIGKLREKGLDLPTEKLLDVIDGLDGGRGVKEDALLDLVSKRPDAKIVVFAQFWKTMDRIALNLDAAGRGYALFRGDMNSSEKDAAVTRFREDVPILLASESGGEGRNLQFADTLVNFDLPWNPMRIEQRIGRLHRIGQTRDVFVFNLAVRGTIEDHILDILESKINMFEMVIGEIEPILGRLAEKRAAAAGDDETEFEDLIFDLWAGAPDADARAEAFGKLGDEMVAARTEYLEGKNLDAEIFGEAFES